MLTDNYALATLILMALGLGAYQLYFAKCKDFTYNRWVLIGLGLITVLLPVIKIPIFRNELTSVPTADVLPIPELQLDESVHFQLDIYQGYWLVVCSLLMLFMMRMVFSFLAVKKFQYQYDQATYSGPAFSFFSTVIVPDPDDAIVYQHESYHAQQGHTWDRIFGELIHWFLWFNPLVFLWKRNLLLNHEYDADQHVMNTLGIKPLEYLIHMQQVANDYEAKSKLQIVFANSYYSFILKRTTMINQVSSKKINPFIIPLLLFLFVVLVSFKTYHVFPESTIQTTMQDTIPRHMIIIDTISYTDEKGDETVRIVKTTKNLESYLNSIDFSGKKITVSDTISMFDTETMTEEIQVVSYSYPVELLKIQDKIDLGSWNLAVKIANEIADKKQ